MKKNNPLLGIGGSFLFLLLGIYLLVEKSKDVNLSNPLLIKILGILCILFFGGLLVLSCIKLIKK